MNRIARLFFAVLALCLMMVPRFAGTQTISEEARRHMARGQAAVEMARSPEEYGDAIKEFEKAAKLAPDWPVPYFNLALLQEKTGRFKEAAVSLREYLRFAPNDPDAAKTRERLYKLEYKAEQTLTVPDIVDVLASGFSWDTDHWRVTKSSPGNARACGGTWMELVFSRDAADAVKALAALRYYQSNGGQRHQTLKVTGPVLRYVTTVNVCDDAANRQLGGCDSVMEHEVEVVSKKLVRVRQKVLSGGSGAGVADGNKFVCTFEKKE